MSTNMNQEELELYSFFKCTVYFKAIENLNIIDKKWNFDPRILEERKFSPMLPYTEEILNLLIHKRIFDVYTPFHGYSFEWSTSKIIVFKKEVKNILSLKFDNDSTYKYLLWNEIALWECLEYFIAHLEDKELNHPQAINAIGLFDSLLEHFSVGQIYNFIHNTFLSLSAHESEDGIMDENKTDYILGIIKDNTQKSINNGVEIPNYSRESICSKSLLSKYYFNEYLKINDEGFNSKPHIIKKIR